MHRRPKPGLSAIALPAVLTEEGLHFALAAFFLAENRHHGVGRGEFPLKVPAKKMERLSELANEIFLARRGGDADLESAKTAESEIGSLIYGLFGLTNRETALVKRK